MDIPLAGDTVSCKINEGLIVYNYVDFYDYIENFEIITAVDQGWLVKVPTRLFLKNSFTVNDIKAKEYSIPKNFIGAEAHFVSAGNIVSIKNRMNGVCCDRCKEYFEYASKDADGKFKCFLCSRYPYR